MHGRKSMKVVHVLLGNSERRINNLVEVALRDVCYNQAVVEFTRTQRVDELLHLGCRRRFDLVILAPDNLVPEPSRRAARVSIDEVVRAIRIIKRQHSIPIIGVGVPNEHQMAILEAGVENAFGILFDSELLKSEVRLVLRFPEKVEPTSANRGSFAETLLRGWQMLTQA